MTAAELFSSVQAHPLLLMALSSAFIGILSPRIGFAFAFAVLMQFTLARGL